MAALTSFLSTSLHCNGIRNRTCVYTTHNNATFHMSRMLTRQQLYCWHQGRSVDFGKLQSLSLNYHDQTFRRIRNCGKHDYTGFFLPASSPWELPKRDVIAFSETGHRKFIEVLDGQEENRQLLEGHLNSHRNAVTMDNTTDTSGIMDKFASLPLSDDLEKYAKEIGELEDQLQELYVEVERMIETGDKGTARELIEANYEAVMEQLEMGVKGVEQAAMLDILAQLNMSLGEPVAVMVLLEQVKEIINNVGNHELLVHTILEHMGSMYTVLQKPKEALPLYTRSLEIQEDVLGKDNLLLVNLLFSLANTYNALGEGKKSIELYHRAISILETTRGAESEDLVFPLTHLSHILIEQYRVDEAEDSLRRALGIVKKLHGENDARVASVMCVLARGLCSKGEIKEAIDLYKEGLYIMEKYGNFSLDAPVLEATRTDLAELLHVVGREEESQQLWEQNLLVKEEALGNDHPGLAVHLQNLATSYAYCGKFIECEYLLRRSLRILSANLVRDSPEISVPMLCLATSLYQQGRHMEAEKLAEEALRIREASFDKESNFVGEACDNLAVIYHSLGKDDEAESLMWRVLQIQERQAGYDSPQVMPTLERLIVLLKNSGKNNERLILQRRLAKLEAKYRN